MNISYLFLLFPLLTTSCYLESTKEPVSSQYCANQIALFSIPDSLEVLTIDYSLEVDTIIASIEQQLDQDICWKEISFGLALPNENPLKVDILLECASATIICGRRFPKVEILMNQRGQILIAGQGIPIDQVKFWLDNNLPVDNSWEGISIHWRSPPPKDSVEKVFENIIEGYLMSCEQLSQQLFSEQVCNLSNQQLNYLKEQLPFKVELDLNLIAPLPPPPLEEELLSDQ